MENIVVIIPTYNASKHLDELLPALAQQSLSPEQYFIIDSSSSDDTRERFRAFGARVHQIDKSTFNHGGTRRLAGELNKGAEILVYMTQDAVPASPDAIAKLVEPFSDENVGMTYGRQLPRRQATAIERHARLMNYGDQSEVRSFEDKAKYGFKVIFCSNSFAAYRHVALDGVGNFPQDSYFAEDQFVSAKMLLAKWKLCYQADAAVVHSHDYTIAEDFRRYFDVGVFHGRTPWLFDKFGKVEGHGMDFLKSEIRYLLKHDPLALPSAGMRTFAKYFGYKLGMREATLSSGWKRKLSMQPSYWKD